MAGHNHLPGYNEYVEPDDHFLLRMIEKQRYSRKPGKKEHPLLAQCLVPDSVPARYLCPGCNQERSKATFLIHQRHGCNDCKIQAQPKVECLACRGTFVNRDQMLQHYDEYHHPLGIQSIICDNKEIFEAFRVDIKMTTGFTMRSTGGKGALSQNRYYRCPEISSCTAFINSTMLEDESFAIKFCIFHSHLSENGAYNHRSDISQEAVTSKIAQTYNTTPIYIEEEQPILELQIPKKENSSTNVNSQEELILVKEEEEVNFVENEISCKSSPGQNDTAPSYSEDVSYLHDITPAVELMRPSPPSSTSPLGKETVAYRDTNNRNKRKQSDTDDMISPEQLFATQKPFKRMPGFLEAEANLARLEATLSKKGVRARDAHRVFAFFNHLRNLADEIEKS